ncbi:MAG TPA: transcription-repair coupling factor [Candidatus Acidoferrum sp.]|nr:transcription-repair coupling factor [Candidatus Acidoferrum sp.]
MSRELSQRVSAYRSALRLMSEGETPVGVTGLSECGKALLACAAGESGALLLAPDETACRQLAANMTGLGANVLQYPYCDVLLHGVEGASREFMHRRLAVLRAVAEGERPIVVATPAAAAQLVIPKELLMQSSMRLSRGQTISLDTLCLKLAAAGYARCPIVEGAGQFSRRGGIVDVFVPGCEQPVRIEFFGDEIDTMHAFDAMSQRRIDAVETLDLPPATHLITDQQVKEKLDELVKKYARRKAGAAIRAELERFEAVGPRDLLQPLLWGERCTLLDYAEGFPVLVSEERACTERLRSAAEMAATDFTAALEEGETVPELCDHALSPGEFWSAAGRHPVVHMDVLPHSFYELAPKSLVASHERHTAGFGETPELLADELADADGKVYIYVADETRKSALSGLVQDGSAELVVGALASGVSYPEDGLTILTDAGIAKKRTVRPKKKTAGEKVRTYSDLRTGDYVVHQNHGIGRYMGISQLKVEGVVKDYIKINYAGTDVLYVPANQLDLVSKYIGGEDAPGKVRLAKLGGVEWAKTRQRVSAAARDMARQLTELYAARQRLGGFAYPPDSEWQASFEASFPYVETEDQLRCVREIKEDMEKPAPMDRLLCGDVGFGKTEVAVRAAFKAIDAGKQVAFLVPTTILSWQHYTTILSRFSTFPMRIDTLSRFRTARQQKDVLKRLRTGELDMVIGTHRLLQKDVAFKNLGLVIIDEEQRFGVAHKEKLKQISNTVDVLTLTATPIPRTLGMALSGIRDMSTIEEPPMDRRPVQTYVLEYDFGIAVDAIKKELRRGGQVFYLYNRVDSIHRVAAKLQERLPDANIVVAHGKMAEDELSDVWQQMVEGGVDVLVCTTIIETGVDVPNANTLIVEDADRLGLSQLYQIRGRIGRSSRRAYAYLTYRRDKVLTEDATKRLSTIREFTEFGSGFKIAMRDLEIRGAGSVLGAEQHGHMEAVGYDLYLKLLEEAVLEERGTPSNRVSCTVDFVIDANIPPEYIDSSEIRIDIYKKIAAIETDEDLSDLYDELIDRFGDIPIPLQNLCRTSLLRNRAGALGISDITERAGNVVIDAAAIPMAAVAKLASENRGRILYSAGSKPYLTCRPKKGELGLATAEGAMCKIEEAMKLEKN